MLCDVRQAPRKKSTLQNFVDTLKAAPTELRRDALARLDPSGLREAWYSCSNVETLAGTARLLTPKVVVASELTACIREVLVDLNLTESQLMTVVVAGSRASSEEELISNRKMSRLAGGREVNFMIFESVEAALAKSKASMVFPGGSC